MAVKDKDPAFLFYTKDWYSGTAEMMPHEKGVYVDFLCYQHQNKGLPNDIKRLARIASMSEREFAPIWVKVKEKFVLVDGVLINLKLAEEMLRRKDKSKKNTISGTFASILRLNKYTLEQYKHLKSKFKVEDFASIETERLTERLTEWIQECLKSIETATVTDNTILDTGKEGVGGKPIIPDVDSFVKYGFELLMKSGKRNYRDYEPQLKLKYEAWISDDWHITRETGRTMISNWKTTLANTVGFFKDPPAETRKDGTHFYIPKPTNTPPPR